LAACEGDWAGDIILLALATGARRGELLAVSWTDIDFPAGAMVIRHSLEQTKEGLRLKSPKNERMRKFTVPPIALEALQRIQQQQAMHRSSYGVDYRADLNLVFCKPDGNYLRPDSVTKAARRLAKKAVSRECLYTRFAMDTRPIAQHGDLTACSRP
jgi:integrase